MAPIKALYKAGGYRSAHCNCFVAGTEAQTPEGEVPIESIRVGDLIVTRGERAPFEMPRIGAVTRVFRDIATAILWLTLSSGATLGVTSDHEVWTLQDGWTTAGRLEPGDAFVDASGEHVEVTETCLDPIPAAVYNLEVYGAFTYFAAGVWVHNNSCDINKLHHIFGNRAHRLDSLIDHFGSEAAAFAAVQNAIQDVVKQRGITGVFEQVLDLGGITLTVRGKVIDGVARIGTFFMR